MPICFAFGKVWISPDFLYIITILLLLFYLIPATGNDTDPELQ